jgi:tetratricopeptide (TPR) repeat protein
MLLAAQLQGRGQLPEAEHYLQYILRSQPQHALALHLLGVIACQVGKLPLAARLIRQAIHSRGDIALFHANLSEICRRLGEGEAAIIHGEEAVRLEPALVMAHSNLGVAYYERKDYEQAVNCQQRALSLNPAFAPALNNMGCIHRELKQYDAAAGWFRKAAAADTRYPDPLNNLGALLLEVEQLDQAQTALDAALQLSPDFADAICNKGSIYLARAEYIAALSCFQRALALRPTYPAAWVGQARALQGLEQLPEAASAVQQAILCDAGNAEAHALLGSIYSGLEQVRQAEACFNRALLLNPQCDAALLGLGYLLMEAGELAQAEDYFRHALAAKPESLSAHIHLTQVHTISPDDPSLLALLGQEKNIAALAPEKAIALEFALGKALDDIGNHAQAFVHYAEGCRRKRQRLRHDADNSARLFAELKDIFRKDYLDALRGGGDPLPAPIFVLGMPRAGTTLVEQIIASHPDVHGCGEIDDLLKIAERERSPFGQALTFPQNLRYLDRATLDSWGSDYIAAVRLHAPQAKRFTDKMPSNFFVVGLIHLLLPNAKIIHVQRHPVDNCLSCFTNLFRTRHEYSYDLVELGRYYSDYAVLMAHWRRILPAGAFLDIRYEDIVANQEAAVRRLLEFCELDWNPACLDFHKNRRTIRTASITQVRQPLYGSSVERWRHYEKHLGPLLDALGTLVPDSAESPWP